MGTIDRIIRFTLAFVVAVSYFIGFISGSAALILGIIAGIFLITSYFGVCPAYNLFSIKTFREVKE